MAATVRTLLTFSVETKAVPRPALVSNRGTAAVRYNPAQRPKYDAMKAIVRGAAEAHLPSNWAPVAGPVELRIVFERARPRSDPERVWKTSRPDAENLVKGTADAMTGLVWVDDSQVVVLLVAEVYGDEDRITVQVSDLSEEGRSYPWQVAGPAF